MNKQSAELLEKDFSIVVDSPGGIKKLRELILTLAMQGKLVEQDPEDQPAGELIAEIAKEKRRLIAEGKIKKQKPLPEIDPVEVPYELPEGWEWVRLGEISINIHYGFTASADFNVSEPKFLRITDIQGNRVNWEKVPGCKIKPKDIDKYRLGNNDLLIARTGGTIGKSFLVDELDVLAVFASYLIRVIPSLKVSSTFLNNYLYSNTYWTQLYNNSAGTGQPNVNGTALSQLLLPLPPLKEQTRIVQKIDSLMALCDELEARHTERNASRLENHASAIHHLLKSGSREEFSKSWSFITLRFDQLYTVKENVEELKKAILTLAMQGKLVEQDPEDQPAGELIAEIQKEKRRLIAEGKIKKQKPLPEIDPDEVPYELPGGWEWVRIRSITHEFGQKIPDNEFTYIDVGSINNSIGKISTPRIIPAQDAPSRARKIVISGTVIYSTVRPYLQNIAIIDINSDHDLIASTAFAVMYPSIGLNRRFLYYYLFSSPHTQYVKVKMKGVAYPAISEGDFSLSLIPLPPKKEQSRIVQKIDSLMVLCDSLIEKIDQRTAQSEKFVDAVLSG